MVVALLPFALERSAKSRDLCSPDEPGMLSGRDSFLDSFPSIVLSKLPLCACVTKGRPCPPQGAGPAALPDVSAWQVARPACTQFSLPRNRQGGMPAEEEAVRVATSLAAAGQAGSVWAAEGLAWASSDWC